MRLFDSTMSNLGLRTPLWMSVVRWVGGKRNSACRIVPHVPLDVDEIVSPFAGGLKVEMKLAQSRGVYIHCGDLHAGLCNFINCVRTDLDTVMGYASLLSDYVTFDNWHHVKNHDVSDPYVDAARFFVALRTSFAGCGTRPARSAFKVQPEETKHAAATYHRHVPLLRYVRSCKNQSWLETLRQHPRIFAYLDPPWPGSNRGHYEHVMDDCEHEDLRQFLIARESRWALSYPGTDSIRNAYSDFRIVDIPTKYTLATVTEDTRATDVLILNY